MAVAALLTLHNLNADVAGVLEGKFPAISRANDVDRRSDGPDQHKYVIPHDDLKPRFCRLQCADGGLDCDAIDVLAVRAR